MSALDWLSAPALLPWAVIHAVHPRLRADVRERFGVDVPPVQPGAVWVVSASVGEVKAAATLMAGFEVPVLWLVDTDTGAALARKLAVSWPHVVAMRRPVDHGFTLAPAWSRSTPRAVVFVEGAWWPKLVSLAKHDDVPVIRVSARAGTGTARWLALGGVGSLVVARSQADADWFSERCGAPVSVGGDLKSSGAAQSSKPWWHRPFAVGACTRPGDELRCLNSGYEGGWLLAPRHLSRVDEVAKIVSESGRTWALWTDCEEGVADDTQVVILDEMGVLERCYVGADFAFIGGTFDAAIGGHSPLEAARAGVPVICGPHTHAQGQAFVDVGARVGERDLVRVAQQVLGQRPTLPKQDAAARTHEALKPYLHSAAMPRAPRPWARPLVPMYRMAEVAHRQSWRWRASAHLPVPVVSIGSANARSPGRTSTVQWMAQQLVKRGHRPGIATRGYRRTGRGLGASWLAHGSAELGDEGAMLASWGWPVSAHADRVLAARALVDRGVSVVILDDGLQRRHLHRDVDLVVVDGRFPGACGWFPAGDAREQPIPERADGVIFHHRIPEGQSGVLAVRRPGPWMHRGVEVALPNTAFAAFAGVGHPGDFFASLPSNTPARALVDHQPVTISLAASLLSWAAGATLLCTAKDHARLPASLQDKVWYRDVQLTIEDAPEAWFPPC